MKVLINALSVTNQSGRHVLMGHLNRLREWTAGVHQYLILFHPNNRDLVTPAAGFEWQECPASTSKWWSRAAWECRNLPRIAREARCDFLFTPAGVAVPGLPIPQVVFCQNPWCLVPSLHRRVAEKLKARLQRKAYASAMRHARLMVFNSEFMHQAYRENARCDAQSALVVYQAIAESTWAAADRLGKRLMEKNHIVSVSAMGSHKGAEVLVRALKRVRDRGVDAKLTFAGGWPDSGYRRLVENEINEHQLQEQIEFRGWISDDALHELYSRAHVFCLLSQCESFGIPAVEAQSFGTPALGTEACAIPEVGASGGLYSPVGDAESAAENLIQVLTNGGIWNRLSQNAKQNAARFRWNECSRPLLKMFDLIESAA